MSKFCTLRKWANLNETAFSYQIMSYRLTENEINFDFLNETSHIYFYISKVYQKMSIRTTFTLKFEKLKQNRFFYLVLGGNEIRQTTLNRFSFHRQKFNLITFLFFEIVMLSWMQKYLLNFPQCFQFIILNTAKEIKIEWMCENYYFSKIFE